MAAHSPSLLSLRQARQPRLMRLERARLQIEDATKRTRNEALRALSWQLHLRAASRRSEAEESELRSLLDRCRVVYEDAHLSLHAPQPALQELFEAIVSSPHSREGRLLARWTQQQKQNLAGASAGGGAAAAAAPSATAGVVLDFANYIARLIIAQHALPPLYLPQVQLCTTRLLLRELQPALWPLFGERAAARDAQFVHQQRRMRRLSPKQYGVEDRFLPSNSPAASPPHTTSAAAASPTDSAAASPPRPAAVPSAAASPSADKEVTLSSDPAAVALSSFCFLAAPADQLLCLYRAIGIVHTTAAAVSGEPTTAIGADSLLPLLVRTALHAHLPRVFTAIEYAKQLSTHVSGHLSLILPGP